MWDYVGHAMDSILMGIPLPLCYPPLAGVQLPSLPSPAPVWQATTLTNTAKASTNIVFVEVLNTLGYYYTEEVPRLWKCSTPEADEMYTVTCGYANISILWGTLWKNNS